MCDELIIRCCAPTLAGIKTGSLFNCEFASKAEMLTQLKRLNLSVGFSGVRALPLKWFNNRAMIYVYRPQMLSRDLNEPLAREILSLYGYISAEYPGCITFLRERLCDENEFPHEIGLFLGYPPEDVRGFINHGECRYTGMWKVFESGVEDAQRKLRKCKSCTAAYLCRYSEGWSLSRLAIPRRFS